MKPLTPPTLDDLRDAQQRLEGLALRTPLVRLYVDAPQEVWLKLECLQPIGSFKIRGGGYAMLTAPREQLAHGVYTASAGNMAQGVAWVARSLGVPCTVVVPDHAPQTKLSAIERLGARVVKEPFARWWQVLVEHEYPGLDGVFVHPVADQRVITGNGTAGLEIMEEMPDVGAILVPFGGGGLAVGIAAAVRALGSEAPVWGCEVETAAPLRASLAAGEATACDYTRSFVDGIGGRSVLAEMWPLARTLLAGSLTVSLAEVAAAVRLLVERAHVVPEGAGATPVACALRGVAGARKVVCVVSGGNIDASVLARILEGASV
jgi:threonine dehydratase